MTSTMLNAHLRDNLNAISSIPGAFIYKNGNQSLPGSQATTWVTITSFSTAHDTDTMTSTADRLTIKTAGRYVLSGAIQYDAASATGNERCARLRQNGNNALLLCEGRAQVANANKNGTAVLPPAIGTFAVNDYLELQGQHDATGALNALGGVEKSFLCARRLAE